MKQNDISNYLLSLYPLHKDALDALVREWQPLIVKRKTLLTAAGETERYLYFVQEGIQRVFYIGEDNQEATIVFTYPPSFSGIADSFLTQTASSFYLETITASKLLRISHTVLQELQLTYPVIKDMLFATTAHALKGVLFRQTELLCFSNEQKFRALLKRSPHILNLVPHKYIASYLGMDATNFSKLLGTVKL